VTEAQEAPTPPKRAATVMGVATATSRGIGFVRIWVITAVLGTTYLGNTYQSSNSVSNVLFELLAAGALSAVLVPTFVRHLERGDDAEAERLASHVLGLALVVLGVIAVAGFVFAPQIARLISSGAPAHLRAAQEELATYLTRFFVFQVLLYGLGTVATAVLYAKRRFVATAMAPIANTVAVVGSLVIFRAMTGPHPSLDVTGPERFVLAMGGMLGVLGFVGVPAVALWRTGFRLLPRVGRPDAPLRELLRLSVWAVLQHGGIGILLGTALAMGNHVQGGVVAYQFAFVAIMAPYAILAQPVHTTILPELSKDADTGDHTRFASQLRWALDNMALLIVPVSAAICALALPAMRIVAVGQSKGGAGLLAAALASLAIGLLPYSAFLLFARASYALGDSRTPAVVALLTAIVGAAVMIVAGNAVHGTAVVAALGIGHTVAYTLGSLWLGWVLRARLGRPIFPHALPGTALVAGAFGVAAWLLHQQLQPTSRGEALLFLVSVGVVGGAAYLVVLRATRRRLRAYAVPDELADEPDLALEE
jgi:putative peptidoglycan lipid II flippase